MTYFFSYHCLFLCFLFHSALSRQLTQILQYVPHYGTANWLQILIITSLTDKTAKHINKYRSKLSKALNLIPIALYIAAGVYDLTIDRLNKWLFVMHVQLLCTNHLVDKKIKKNKERWNEEIYRNEILHLTVIYQ